MAKLGLMPLSKRTKTGNITTLKAQHCARLLVSRDITKAEFTTLKNRPI